ncbi:MAG: hypothetical protein KKF41_03690 [Actinobacteria bacterium]|nr:hypothetical protein [Actinomycetota bacterium]MBU1944997.1 hypothetical protein [Actinomycetota bacterium]MBU2686667.1 hypothetical protein [Actinomycetota bacterium]
MPEDIEAGRHGKHHHILRRYWEIVNLYPRITDPELARRIEEFTMKASPEQLFRMQRAVISHGTEFMVKDPRWSRLLEHMDGKRVGMSVGDEYHTTVTLNDGRFDVTMGKQERGVPVLHVASRKDYVDALLRRKDLVRMLVTRKLGATHKLTLIRWGITIFEDFLADDSLFEDLLAHQSRAQELIAESMGDMDF